MIRFSKFSKKSIQLVLGIILGIFLLSYLKNPLQAQQVGGPCEGCEAALEYGDQKLSSSDTLPEFDTHSNQMLVTGTVYQVDGTTPAADVIIYIYHTNEKGKYPTKDNESGYARRHGYLRAWTKTDSEGHYAFYTFKPASYPSRTEPAHIHITVKEPDKNPYYLDSIEFEEDPLLTTAIRNRRQQRGGSGIVTLAKTENGLIYCKRHIFLGRNIPKYPL